MSHTESDCLGIWIESRTTASLIQNVLLVETRVRSTPQGFTPTVGEVVVWNFWPGSTEWIVSLWVLQTNPLYAILPDRIPTWLTIQEFFGWKATTTAKRSPEDFWKRTIAHPQGPRVGLRMNPHMPAYFLPWDGLLPGEQPVSSFETLGFLAQEQLFQASCAETGTNPAPLLSYLSDLGAT